mgnify:CR=1 FL=1
MKIGIDARMFGQKQTGIGIYIENLIKNILKLNNKNEYILFLKNPSNETIECFKKYKNVKTVLVSSAWYSWSEQLVFPWQIFKERVDLMHFPHFNVPVFCPVKFVVTIHDMTPKYFPGNKVGKSFFRRKIFDLVMGFALNKSEKVIAVSEFTKNEILKFYQNIKSEKIEVIYEGLRGEFFSDIKISQKCASSETLASLSCLPAGMASGSAHSSSENLFSDTSQLYQKTPSKFSCGCSSKHCSGEYKQLSNCGSCRRCLDVCPTGALEAPYTVNASKCISYLTIEHKGEIPVELRGKMGNWIFGCDICQKNARLMWADNKKEGTLN